MALIKSRSTAPTPFRGEVWSVDLNPTRGHEQSGERPCVIISSDIINSGPAEMVFAIPLTSKDRGVAVHVRTGPPEVALTSVILCDQLRAISKERLKRRLGAVNPSTLREVEDRLKIIMDL